jgi:uncharacterized protein YlxW (UPF0749 family)
MKLDAYLDLIKSNLDVVSANVTMAMETLDADNQRLVERVFNVEKENMRLVTEVRMMKEENNHLKAEVIKLLDTINQFKNANEEVEDDCIGCEYGKCECTAGCDPDEPCCQEKAMESGN